MRADRMLTLLMLLQNRGRMTAGQLAAELEVTERTIYRDIDALCAAGVPVVSESGPSGGYSLIEGYRSRLTGLTDDEVQALGALSVAAPLADLNLSRSLQNALLKLTASVREEKVRDIERLRQRVMIDAQPWEPDKSSVPALTALYQAALQDRLVRVTFVGPNGIRMERTFGVLGLVAKAGTWNVVSSVRGRPRVQAAEDLIIVQQDCGAFQRPRAFELGAFWAKHCAGKQALGQYYRVSVSVSPSLLPFLDRILGQATHMTATRPSVERPGWHDVELAFPDFEHARNRLLGCGSGLLVQEPYQLAVAVADVAAQIVDLYASDG